MKTLLIIGSVIALLLLGSCASYSGLISADETVKTKWGNVESQLQRRYDLVPNLVNTVKAYATHEAAVFTGVAQARSAWANASTTVEKQAASNNMESALARLMVVVESNPTLKADANFRSLQDELAGTENRISVARQAYNEAVNICNRKVRIPPSSFFAGMAGVALRENFTADAAAKTAPVVKF